MAKSQSNVGERTANSILSSESCKASFTESFDNLSPFHSSEKRAVGLTGASLDRGIEIVIRAKSIHSGQWRSVVSTNV